MTKYWPIIKEHLISVVRVFLAAFVFFLSTATPDDWQAALKGACIAGISAVLKLIILGISKLAKPGIGKSNF